MKKKDTNTKIKTVVNAEGEPLMTEMAIPIEGSGGETGRRAVIQLTALINTLKNMQTEQDVITHYYIICGFATCCLECGFMTEESTDELMHLVEHLVKKEIARAEAADKNGQR